MRNQILSNKEEKDDFDSAFKELRRKKSAYSQTLMLEDKGTQTPVYKGKMKPGCFRFLYLLYSGLCYIQFHWNLVDITLWKDLEPGKDKCEIQLEARKLHGKINGLDSVTNTAGDEEDSGGDRRGCMWCGQEDGVSFVFLWKGWARWRSQEGVM